MKRKKLISLALALIMIGNLLPMHLKANAASISDDDREDIVAIYSYLHGILVGTEAVDINEDNCINAVDLTLAKRNMLGDDKPALKPLEADTWDIYLNEEATVTFTVQTVSITDPVILYDEADDVLAEMHDDGKNGDKTAGDSIYTATAVLSSDKTKNAGYYAAAGELRSEPFEICFYRDMEDEDINGFLTLFWKISEMSFDEASEFIMQSDEISSFSADEELKQIWYQSVYGIQGCFEEPQESEEQTLGSGVRIDISDGGYDYKAAEEYIEANTFTPAHPDKRDVIVLRPFQKNLPKPVFSRAGELLANALDGSLTELDDQDVTLEQLKNLDSYGTVLLNTHGVLVDSNRDESIPSVIYLLTGESVPNGNIDIAFPWQSYSADFWAGRVACFGAGSSYRISVSYKFFDKYYASGSLDQSFWFLGACYSLHNYQLADTLISKGAGAVIGYSDVTSTHYCYKTMLETVINSMVLNAENVKKAVLESKARYGYFDPYNPENEMRFRGRPHFKLVEAAGDNTGPSNIYTYNGHDYKVIHSSVTWSVAKEYCEMQGGHLATITSEGEERFIEQMLKNEYYYIKEGICWLGATDEKKEGTWEWVTGEEFSYSNWGLYNPDNRDHGVYGSENWLVIRRQHWTGDGKITVKFTWEDFAEVVCEGYNDVIKYKTGFICEWD